VDRLKDPAEVLDWVFDWSAWLSENENIASHTVTAEDGITLASHTEDDGVITAWLSGGTAGERYALACHVVTTAGREGERTINITVRER
jgi:hypothetical protein